MLLSLIFISPSLIFASELQPNQIELPIIEDAYAKEYWPGTRTLNYSHLSLGYSTLYPEKRTELYISIDMTQLLDLGVTPYDIENGELILTLFRPMGDVDFGVRIYNVLEPIDLRELTWNTRPATTTVFNDFLMPIYSKTKNIPIKDQLIYSLSIDQHTSQIAIKMENDMLPGIMLYSTECTNGSFYPPQCVAGMEPKVLVFLSELPAVADLITYSPIEIEKLSTKISWVSDDQNFCRVNWIKENLLYSNESPSLNEPTNDQYTETASGSTEWTDQKQAQLTIDSFGTYQFDIECRRSLLSGLSSYSEKHHIQFISITDIVPELLISENNYTLAENYEFETIWSIKGYLNSINFINSSQLSQNEICSYKVGSEDIVISARLHDQGTYSQASEEVLIDCYVEIEEDQTVDDPEDTNYESSDIAEDEKEINNDEIDNPLSEDIEKNITHENIQKGSPVDPPKAEIKKPEIVDNNKQKIDRPQTNPQPEKDDIQDELERDIDRKKIEKDKQNNSNDNNTKSVKDIICDFDKRTQKLTCENLNFIPQKSECISENKKQNCIVKISLPRIIKIRTYSSFCNDHLFKNLLNKVCQPKFIEVTPLYKIIAKIGKKEHQFNHVDIIDNTHLFTLEILNDNDSFSIKIKMGVPKLSDETLLSRSLSYDKKILEKTKPYRFPFDQTAGVTQWHGYTSYDSPHTGIDFGVKNFEVYATADGTIQSTGYDTYLGECNSGGYYINIKHTDERHSLYLHLDESYYKDHQFKKGDPISKGQIIGISGNSGAYNCQPLGYHLHFEIRNSSTQNTHTDPVPLVEQDWSKIITLQSNVYPGRLIGDNPHPNY